MGFSRVYQLPAPNYLFVAGVRQQNRLSRKFGLGSALKIEHSKT